MAKEENIEEENNEEEEETVEVSKELLEEVLRNQEESKKKISKLEDENEKLNSIADQARKQRYEDQQEDELVKTIRIPFYKTPEGTKLVSGWSMGEDSVGYTRDGKPFFKQTVNLIVENEDGETEEIEDIDYSLFFKNMESEKAEVIEEKEVKRKDGVSTMFTAKLENGREVEIDSKFINAF